MSKSEESRLDKFKQFLGINKGKGPSGISPSATKSSSKEFIITQELLQDIGSGSPSSQRLRAIRELSETVSVRRLEEHATEAIWLSVHDLLETTASEEDRKTVFRLLQCLVKGQYENLGMLRAQFFKVIQDHDVFADLPERLELFKTLTDDGKDLEYFEEEAGPFLLKWMKEIMNSSKMNEFLMILVKVIKFNAAHLDETVMSGLVLNTCIIANRTSSEETIELCLQVIDTIVCYSCLPIDVLFHVVACLCRIVNVEKFSQACWALMRKLLGTHLGHSGIHCMCCMLQDKSNQGDHGAALLRGAIFFVGMALWGYQKIGSLRYPPSAVLPSFLQALQNTNHSIVALELVLSLKRLVGKYGKEQARVTWDIVLETLQALLMHIESAGIANPNLVSNTHELLGSVEELYQHQQYCGSEEMLFRVIDKCAAKRPESSLLLLISYKTRAIHPCREDWLAKLSHLLEKYFRNESRRQIRLKALDVLASTIRTHKHLYEDELIEVAVLPHLSSLEVEVDLEVRCQAGQLLVELIQGCTTPRCADLLHILSKVLQVPRLKKENQAAASASVAGSEAGAVKGSATLRDLLVVVQGLVKAFRSKLYQLPSSHALTIFHTLIEHIQLHYECAQLRASGGEIRKLILECFVQMKADSTGHLGFREKDTAYSPYITCLSVEEEEEEADVGSPSSPTVSIPPVPPCKVTRLPFGQAFTAALLCLQEELEWPVLKTVLQELPLLLQNKTLVLTSDQEDFIKFCAQLCAMVSDRSLGLPEKLKYPEEQPLTRSEFHCFIFPVLTALVSYHGFMDKMRQRELVKCLEFGVVSKCAFICVRALTVCAYEMDDVMMRLLPAVLQRLSQVAATVAMAIPLMEFLSSLVRIPQLYANFVEEQYRSVFAIALPYTNPFKYSHYAVSLAYNVIALWFLKCRLPFRKTFVNFIVKGLNANVHRQFEELALARSRQNEDSQGRMRTASMDDSLKKKRAAVLAKTRPASLTSSSGVSPVPDESMASFHRELSETCVDMLARYTFSNYSNMPKRSPVAEHMLANGRSQHWLLGNKLITITTCSSQTAPTQQARHPLPGVSDVDTHKGEGGRRRHRSAAVKTLTESIALMPSSQDDILLHKQPLAEAPTGGRMCQLSPLASSNESLQSYRSGSSMAQQQDSWALPWVEVHVRAPTGNTSWMMRLQNEHLGTVSAEDLSVLFSTDLMMRVDQDALLTDAGKMEEAEYDRLHQAAFSGSDNRRGSEAGTREGSAEDMPLYKTCSSPDLPASPDNAQNFQFNVNTSTNGTDSPSAENTDVDLSDSQQFRFRSHTVGSGTLKKPAVSKLAEFALKPPEKSFKSRSKTTLDGTGGSGVHPAFVFLQLYLAGTFGQEEKRPLMLPPKNEVVERAVKMLDLLHPCETHKIGVVYVGKGQANSETEILCNRYGSPRYIQFLQGLGTLLPLKDCNPEQTYVGGLDLHGNDGQFAFTWNEDFMQVVFHVATLMPNRESDPNCNAKKLHIGNDYVHIIYNNSNEEYKIGTIKGQFNYVNIVIQPLDHESNAVTVQARQDIEDIIGHTDTKVISDEKLAKLVRQMAVHANQASLILQRQKTNPEDPYASNWLERLRQIKRINQKAAQEIQRNRNNGSCHLLEDFTDFV